ncbi:cell surface glycoprotein MUC18 [Pimephales promelas]|nr:cell surface glycoprotein MUC18 [Pimephales promelas]
MEFLMTEATCKLLIILCMIQGTYGMHIHHNVSVTAVEGQNVSLPCFVGEEHEIKIIQVEWLKQKNDKNDKKIVVFHPSMPEHYFQTGPLLTKITSSKTGKLQGSVLTLYEVTMKDSGNYTCEITFYPIGSIKRTTKLQVTEPPASVKMSHPYRFIKEGDEVKISCSASPPPLSYELRRSKDKLFWMESLNGEFILPKVTRNNSDLYICSPEWSSVQNQQGLNTTIELTVNFLDDIECNTSSPFNVGFGEDVTISCIAKASQYLQYKWIRDDTTLSLSDTLSLTSVTSSQSGTYKLTAVFQDNQLQTDIEFYINVLSKQVEGTYGMHIHHNVSVTAVEGQNVSLPCFVGEEHEIKIIQVEWLKQKNDKNDKKIVVFHPSMPEFYFQTGPLLTKITSSKTGKLQGSVLILYEVAMKDSGNYTCEITVYPIGSIKRTTKLQVTERPASVKMSHPYRFIKEGDEVKISCSASPPPLSYELRRSKDKLFWMLSLNGEFILPKVTRNNSDLYICSPEWSSVQNQQGLNTTIELTVNFLDDIECNTSSPFNVGFGEDVTISCIAKASQYLQYKWMRDDTTLSLSDTLSLTSVTSSQSGTYKLTAVFQDNQLQTDIEFYINVLSKQVEGKIKLYFAFFFCNCNHIELPF